MYSSTHLNRSWVEVDLEQIRENYRIYKKSVLSDEIMAVIKADAYGHGDVEVASVLQAEGVKIFAVSNIEEVITLRDAGITGEILVLGHTPEVCSERLLKYNITQALLDENYAKMLANKGVIAQFAIDTGMNRIGLDADNPNNCEKIIRKYFDSFELTGMFTHLCVADKDTKDCKSFTEQQIGKFGDVAKRVEDLNLTYVHCMNSAGGLFHRANKNIREIARLGIILYGLKPDYFNVLPAGIKPALEWKSVIAMIKNVHSGESIGYGRTFIAEHEMKVATIPTGYADGYRRELSNKGKVEINGKEVSVVGRVCMDQIMVDVTELDLEYGDEVTLIGEYYTADDMARDIGTIGYEIVCGISKRVSRIYKLDTEVK